MSGSQIVNRESHIYSLKSPRDKLKSDDDAHRCCLLWGLSDRCMILCVLLYPVTFESTIAKIIYVIK